MLDVVFDMETGDPDDLLTLLLLAGHPRVRLTGVTVVPGSAAQVGVVRHALRLVGRDDVRVGAGNLDHARDVVSLWHYRALGDVAPSRDAEDAAELLGELSGSDTTLVCGGPLTNVRRAIASGRLTVGRLVVQGGFAGEGVVPAERQLEKFRGRVTCPSYNLNGDPRAVFAVLAHDGIGHRRFVSKNVCHGVVYDAAVHARFAEQAHRDSTRMIHRLMEVYLRGRPGGKMFHDPLAACCAIDPAIGTWAEVELYRERGEWGSRPQPGSGTWIITGYDRERFLTTLLE
ncbi:nucleoside hydrolase [Dactylosporangium sp. AC04546]|uniref:nucleoside hydrolase n=1 Tax=Dactylosporangium sp. AC04546 TaxID=2862460 RepID=UPI001EDDFB8E|nr:nucleoside hydrolase [Dactylosporangium sp. AC04546]WVK88590.1 nucleoside hydrolase [Dactylosporangium sp. AC04546]